MIPAAFPRFRYLQNLFMLRNFLIMEIRIRGPDPGPSAVRYGAIPRDGAEILPRYRTVFFRRSAHALRLGFTRNIFFRNNVYDVRIRHGDPHCCKASHGDTTSIMGWHSPNVIIPMTVPWDADCCPFSVVRLTVLVRDAIHCSGTQ
jgi:hypothetical protein